MPTFYADTIAGSSPSLRGVNLGDRIDGALITSRLSMAWLTYTLAGTEAANDIVRLFRGRQGMIIIPHLSIVHGNGIAATATLDVGDDDVLGVGAAADADRYADGLDVAAAGSDLFNSVAPTTAARATPYRLGSDAWIEAKFATLVTPVAGKILQFQIFYGGA